MGLDPKRLADIWAAARGPASFVLGTGILIYEMIARHPVDAELLIVAGGLVGLPLFTSGPD